MGTATGDSQLWILLPWSIFAVAAGVKLWRITSMIRHGPRHQMASTEQARQRLERLWQKDQPSTR